jgi:hypothetical protein
MGMITVETIWILLACIEFGQNSVIFEFLTEFSLAMEDDDCGNHMNSAGAYNYMFQSMMAFKLLHVWTIDYLQYIQIHNVFLYIYKFSDSSTIQ